MFYLNAIIRLNSRGVWEAAQLLWQQVYSPLMSILGLLLVLMNLFK
ncbi:uncharacterized protein METZ01_LOCUS252048 [marine metagenome]|uniref:Uncharacterized protein n=1 Tax=marine metagenome TaxID=408172 RepID=A0A382IHH2_9ZZZZ